jgi:membrane-associated protease RseP (regulator of RpoE activity)
MSVLAVFGAIAFFVGILASVALHEIGHLIPAKLFDVKVTQYFVGFGKTLWSTRRGETEYGLKLIPAGGFVRLIGMMPPNADGKSRRWSTGAFQALVDDARSQASEELRPGEEARAFYSKKWWQKVVVMLAGPMVNLILAVLLVGVAMIGIGVYNTTTTVAAVSDCVIAAPAGSTARTCTAADPIAPAKAAGVQAGDRIVSVAGAPIATWLDAQHAIRAAAGKTVPVVVERSGSAKTLEISVISTTASDLNDPTKTVQAGFIGVTPTQIRARATVGQTFATLGSMVEATGSALVHLPQRMVGVAEAAFGGTRAQDSPMSVIGASRIAGEVAAGDIGGTKKLIVSDRVQVLLQLLGGVNLFVGILNLVPLLPLDGGHIAGALWEAVKRGVARLRGRPDPGHVDVAKALPVTYAVASVLVVMGALLMVADIVNPIRLS